MKIKHSKINLKTVLSRSLMVLSIVAMGAYSFTHSTPVAADLNSEIAALESQIGAYQAEAAKLRGQAESYQNEVNRLNAEKNAIQAQVNLSQAKYDKLVEDIAANERKMAEQQKVMSNAISDLSSESTTSPIELLASSKNIGDYIDQQEYSTSVRDQLETAIKRVKELKAQLNKQKEEVTIVLNDQKNQRDQLAAKEAEQATLLAQTQGQEASYQQLIGQKNNELAGKRAAQAAAMRGRGSEGIVYGSSSYPWMSEPMNPSTYNDNCLYRNGGSAADPWGYCKRQCVSYVAWKLNTDGRGNRNYSGLGNASNWGYGGGGVPMGSVQPGDVIVWYVGYYGHVMYVEEVNGDDVKISQMNVPYDSGAYSTKWYSINGSKYTNLSNGAYEARRFH